MSVLANFSGLTIFAQWIYILIEGEDFNVYVRPVITIGYGVAQAVVFSLLFRLLSVYVQLRAQSLNSKIIVREIRWANMY